MTFERTCPHCGETFTGPRRTWCYTCQPAYGTIDKLTYTRIAVELHTFKTTGKHGLCCGISRRPIAAVKPPKPARPIGHCEICDVEIVMTQHNRKRCSSEACAIVHRRRKHERYSLANTPAFRDRRRQGWRNRRAKLRQVESEPYATHDIADRDHWRCSLCGLTINRSAICPASKALTMDHIVPMSHGGADAPHNVRAAHFGCNVRKGNRVHGAGEQLMLIG